MLVWSAQFWLPLPDDLLWVAFGYCLVSLLSIRTTPLGLLRLRFRFGLATAAETVQPLVRAVGAGLAVVFMPSVLGFVIAWAAAEVAVALLSNRGEVAAVQRVPDEELEVGPRRKKAFDRAAGRNVTDLLEDAARDLRSARRPAHPG